MQSNNASKSFLCLFALFPCIAGTWANAEPLAPPSPAKEVTATDDMATAYPLDWDMEYPATKETVEAIKKLGKTNPRVSIPLFRELFRQTPRSTRKQETFIHPIRRTILETSSPLSTHAAQKMLADIVIDYVRQGSLSSDIGRPYDDDEYSFVVAIPMKALASRSNTALIPFFLEVADNDQLEYSMREDAYAGYLTTQLDVLRLATVPERTRWLLQDFTTSGSDDNDFDSRIELPLGKTTSGKTEVGIKNAARHTVLCQQGKAALPMLDNEWQALEARKPLTNAQQSRQYAIAEVINNISRTEKIPHTVLPMQRSTWEEIAQALAKRTLARQAWLLKTYPGDKRVEAQVRGMALKGDEKLSENDRRLIDELYDIYYNDKSKRKVRFPPPTPLPADMKDARVKELVDAIGWLGAAKEVAALPILRALYPTTPKAGATPGELHPVRKAIIDATLQIGGEKAKALLKD